MGRGIHDWLDSHFHFSFSDYYNPDNINFGVLRVINDDLVKANNGFGPHPHENMEIISYVVEGELTHGDSMGNDNTLTRGQVQYMSAGTGVVHKEANHTDKTLRFLQIWILPDKRGYKPNYGDVLFDVEDRRDNWLPIATWTRNSQSDAPIKIHADVNVYASLISEGKTLDFPVEVGRQAYLVIIEGNAVINGIAFSDRDALEIIEESITVEALSEAHVLIIEMAKE
jgi:redox-sensitive bicupin YhaK (pirin superfamily)